MMLLTLDDIRKERRQALEAWKESDKTIPWETWWDNWLCRAQVEKVTAEYELRFLGPMSVGDCPSNNHPCLQPAIDCWECHAYAFHKALEQAAGGE